MGKVFKLDSPKQASQNLICLTSWKSNKDHYNRKSDHYVCFADDWIYLEHRRIKVLPESSSKNLRHLHAELFNWLSTEPVFQQNFLFL